MNNKGFTLIELLSVVAILGLVGVVVTISLSSSLKKLDEDKCNNFVEEIEQGACVLANIAANRANCVGPQCPEELIGVVCTRGNCVLTLGNLIDNGYIDRDINPCDNSNLNNNTNRNKKITVTWDNSTGEMTCKYNR